MSQSVKLDNDNLLDSGSVITHLLRTSGTYTTAAWAVPSSKPTLTLPYKGLYLVTISWGNGKIIFPAYMQFQCRVVSGSASIFVYTPVYLTNASAAGARIIQATHIVNVKTENTVIAGVIWTDGDNVSITEDITAVYLGKSYE